MKQMTRLPGMNPDPRVSFPDLEFQTLSTDAFVKAPVHADAAPDILGHVKPHPPATGSAAIVVFKIICYPTGRPMDFGEREIEAIKRIGYLGAMSTIPDVVRYDNSLGDQIYSLSRLGLPDNMTVFIQFCSWIECARRSC